MPPLTFHDVTVSYRDWLVDLARREAHDCGRLRGVLSERTQCVVEATRSWSPERRQTLLVALTKACKLGVEPLPPTPEELDELRKWSWSPSERSAAHVLAGLRVGVARGEFRLDRRKLRSTVRRVLGAALGRAHPGSGEMCFVSKLE